MRVMDFLMEREISGDAKELRESRKKFPRRLTLSILVSTFEILRQLCHHRCVGLINRVSSRFLDPLRPAARLRSFIRRHSVFRYEIKCPEESFHLKIANELNDSVPFNRNGVRMKELPFASGRANELESVRKRRRYINDDIINVNENASLRLSRLLRALLQMDVEKFYRSRIFQFAGQSHRRGIAPALESQHCSAITLRGIILFANFILRRSLFSSLVNAAVASAASLAGLSRSSKINTVQRGSYPSLCELFCKTEEKKRNRGSPARILAILSIISTQGSRGKFQSLFLA